MSTDRATDDFAIDYVEIYTGDLDAQARHWQERYAFALVGRAGSAAAGFRSAAFRHGAITLVFTQATAPGHPAAEYVRRHGDGVTDIAFRTADVTAALDELLSRGARLRGAPAGHDAAGSAMTAVVGGVGDIVHTLVRRDPAAGPGLPAGFTPVPGPMPAGANEVGLLEVDHVAACLEAGTLEPAVAFYEEVFGFRETFKERIEIGSQAMESKVVQSASEKVTFTLIAPDPQADPGQIDDFLREHGGAGVQHLAFSTGDAVRTVRTLAARGVTFLTTPGTYYDRLGERITPASHTLDELRETNLLADEDHAGQLFQIFTASAHARRTLFFEVIERNDAESFGTANIKALYEAVELERSRGGSR